MKVALPHDAVGEGAGRSEVAVSWPKYVQTRDTRTVDLSPDGIGCIPVLGENRYKRIGGGTKPHVHPGIIEIICCRRGANLSFESNGKIVPFRPGTVFSSQPNVPHFLRLYPKSLSTFWIWFKLPGPGETVLDLSSAETEWLVGRLRSLPVSFAFTDALSRSFRRLWQLYDDASRGTVERRLLMRDAATRLLIDVVEASSMRADGHMNEQLGAIIGAIRKDPSRVYSIDELASGAAMSVAKLTESFRRETGLPPHAFVVFCRIVKAKELLSSTRKSVGAIANELGFASPQHFATRFRRETGKTPLEWRFKGESRH